MLSMNLQSYPVNRVFYLESIDVKIRNVSLSK